MLQRLKGAVRARMGLDRVNAALTTLALRADEAERNIRDLQPFSRVMAGTVTMEHTRYVAGTVVSIVMATRDRRDLLERAVGSVLRSAHEHWQLVIVDDGSTDGTADFLATLDDARILVQRTEGVGAAAARNVGLAHATGEWVAFLDDDNVIGQWWTKAIAEFGDRNPEAMAVYGGQLRQYEPGVGPSEWSYMLYIDPFDRPRLSNGNYIDLGALAVRRAVDQLWFDPELRRFIDWEMVVRIAAQHDLHALPVLTGVYFTRHDARITHTGRFDAWDEMGRRLRDIADPLGRPRPRP
ncbi:MAG: glycosyltransferase family 2 protein [Ilumatobacteraceae bacterium]